MDLGDLDALVTCPRCTAESLSTVKGPFVEAPEHLGGFWVIDGADEEAALGWAARASKALGGRIEVRAFQVPPGE